MRDDVAHDHAEQRALAGAVRADDGDDLGRGKREVDAVEDLGCAVAGKDFSTSISAMVRLWLTGDFGRYRHGGRDRRLSTSSWERTSAGPRLRR